MLKLINKLCKSDKLEEEQDLLQIIQNSKEVFNDLINFKHPKTNDTLIIYASRCGNFKLLKLIAEVYSKYNPINSKDIFKITNNDGKNCLHEACQNKHLKCVIFLVNVIGMEVNVLRKGDWYY
jgi:ankyrin repeat protein